MLNAVEDTAKERGWLTISEDTTNRGLLFRILKAANSLLLDLDPHRSSGRIAAFKVAGVGVDFERYPRPEPSQDLRAVLTQLADLLAENGSGLLITIDEMQGASRDDIRQFGSVLQHVTRREERPVAFVGAGLPDIEDRFLSGKAETFLQRCSRRDIGPLDNQAAATAIAIPIQDRRASIPPKALNAAVQAVSGYAFMTQLVGFHMWKAAANPYAGITTQEAAIGIEEAERQMARLVLAPIWKNLSHVDRQFLLAMAHDPGESKIADVADRLGKSLGYAAVYRRRLMRAGMITPVRKGWITFAHHAARQWLKRMSTERATSHSHPTPAD